jgi:hypothetical protein
MIQGEPMMGVHPERPLFMGIDRISQNFEHPIFTGA